jgi:tetratricopeptide (TPR) repeat protein
MLEPVRKTAKRTIFAAAGTVAKLTRQPVAESAYLQFALRWNFPVDVAMAEHLADKSENPIHQKTAGRALIAGCESRLSRVKTAERCFRRALSSLSEDPEAIAYLALSYDCQGRQREAKSLYDRASKSIQTVRSLLSSRRCY